MPRIAYSDEDRKRIRAELVRVGLELMTKQGSTAYYGEQIYKKVGISRTFFYSSSRRRKISLWRHCIFSSRRS